MEYILISILILIFIAYFDAKIKSQLLGGLPYNSIPDYFKSKAQLGKIIINYEFDIVLVLGGVITVLIAVLMSSYSVLIYTVLFGLSGFEFIAYWHWVAIFNYFGIKVQGAHWEVEPEDGKVTFGELPRFTPWLKFCLISQLFKKILGDKELESVHSVLASITVIIVTLVFHELL